MFEQGKILSLSANLTNFRRSKALDISNLVGEINITEDIFSTTLSGTVEILDSVNLLGGVPGFPIVGEEFIELSYTVSWEPEPVTIFLRFLVYGITNIERSNNSTSKTYILNICSEEHLIDATTKVAKGYTDLHSNIAKNIFSDYLLLDKENIPYRGKRIKKFNVPHNSRGIQNVCIPYLSPFQSIEFLARRSISELSNSGAYLFFENFKGYNFCDIEYLIKTGVAKAHSSKDNGKNYLDDFTYYFENPVITTSNANRAQKTIISMVQKNMFDTIEKLKHGMFESRVHIYDYINKRILLTSFDFLDSGQNKTGQKTNNSTVVLGNQENSMKSYPENSLEFIKTFTSNENKPSTYKKYFYIPKDYSINDTYLDLVYKNRASYFTRLAQNMYTIVTTGNPNLNAGDVILALIPSGDGVNVGKEVLDKYMTGYYLVCSINHKITSFAYATTMDIYKNAYGYPVEQNQESPIIPENNKQKLLDIALEQAEVKNYLPGQKIEGVSDFFKKLLRRP
jgi:hypothetical protein